VTKSLYYCVLCGARLTDDVLGLLYCDVCKINFLPSYDPEDDMLSVSWISRQSDTVTEINNTRGHVIIETETEVDSERI